MLSDDCVYIFVFTAIYIIEKISKQHTLRSTVVHFLFHVQQIYDKMMYL